MTPDQLKSAIKRLGCTQRAVAIHMGISEEALSRMVHATKPISRRTALLIEEWLGAAPVNPPPRRAIQRARYAARREHTESAWPANGSLARRVALVGDGVSGCGVRRDAATQSIWDDA
jgi:transcriptional regulator with XRE-family HTH domain